MTPLWPIKAFNDLGHEVRKVFFSPSGSQLAFVINSGQRFVHVWDRWGKQTRLVSANHIHCLECSLDGEHLALGSEDRSIRIWHSGSFNSTSSNTHRQKTTRTPQQAGTIILGGGGNVMTLSFSRTDSNILASGCTAGVIKLWNLSRSKHVSTPLIPAVVGFAL
jgi:WD40 repeat protein